GIVLDVGCGYGRIAKYLLPLRSLPGYVGLDGSPTMLGTFSERYSRRPEEQRTPLLLIRSPIDDLPLTDGSVQSVVISAVLLHNPKRVSAGAIDEAHRVLT